jgi:hypothetical protein
LWAFAVTLGARNGKVSKEMIQDVSVCQAEFSGDVVVLELRNNYHPVGYGVAVTSMTLTHQPGVRLPVSELPVLPKDQSPLFFSFFLSRYANRSRAYMFCIFRDLQVRVDGLVLLYYS